jgi:hypothetical protein
MEVQRERLPEALTEFSHQADAAAAAAAMPSIYLDSLQAKLESLRIQLRGAMPSSTTLRAHSPESKASGAQCPPPDEVPLNEAPLREHQQARLRAAQHAALRASAELDGVRAQLQAQRAELDALRSAKHAAAEALGQRVRELEAASARQLARSARLEREAGSAAEGRGADLAALRRRLAAAEHRQRRLHVLLTRPPGDQRDAVLARHRRSAARECGGAPGAPGALGASAASTAQEGWQQLEEEMAQIRAALASAGAAGATRRRGSG